MSSPAERRQQILDGIAKAAAIAKRDPADVQLIAVSKGRTAEEVAALGEPRAASASTRRARSRKA